MFTITDDPVRDAETYASQSQPERDYDLEITIKVYASVRASCMEQAKELALEEPLIRKSAILNIIDSDQTVSMCEQY